MRQPLLALLAKEPAHGYELKLALEQTFGQAYPSPNIGQIYVTLKRLEQDGLVLSQDVEAGQPPQQEGVRVAGREQLAAWVTEPIEGPRVRDEFFMKLVLAPMAGLADRMELINSQRRHYFGITRNLMDMQASMDSATPAARLLVEGACGTCRWTWTGWNAARRNLFEMRLRRPPEPPPDAPPPKRNHEGRFAPTLWALLRARGLAKVYKTGGVPRRGHPRGRPRERVGEFVAIMGPSGSGKSRC